MSVAVSIVFTGMCALVTGGDHAPAQVLLVDGQGREGKLDAAVPRHSPMLVASLDGIANAEDSRPTRIIVGPERLGLWDLAGSEVRVKVQGREGEGVEFVQPGVKSKWPAPPANPDDRESWRDLRYVPDMQRLNGGGLIDPRLVGSDEGEGQGMPSGISARVHLRQGRISGGMPTVPTLRTAVFEFPGAGLRQAVTDTVDWALESDEGAIVIEIAPIGGGAVKRLILAPREGRHEVYVTNLPATDLGGTHHSVPDEGLAARHFEAYYELLANASGPRPVPTRLAPGDERGATGLGGTAVCPPARFLAKQLGISVH